jgi:membrane-associated PAP2 superfamily phosphatase
LANSMIKHIFLTVLVLLLTIVVFEFANIDIIIQDYFFNFDHARWLLDRNNEIPKFIFYDGIKKLYVIFSILLFSVLIFYRRVKIIQNYQQQLKLVLFSIIIVPVTIGGLKAITNIPCPKDIKRYGGQYYHATLLSGYPNGERPEKRLRCYPAGHASGGFALLSLLFLFKKRGQKIMTFASVMILSWSIGIYKMSIGDHFLSHTIVSMLLAWLIVVIIAKIIFSFSGNHWSFNNSPPLPS